jgi:hypothetical protein
MVNWNMIFANFGGGIFLRLLQDKYKEVLFCFMVLKCVIAALWVFNCAKD